MQKRPCSTLNWEEFWFQQFHFKRGVVGQQKPRSSGAQIWEVVGSKPAGSWAFSLFSLSLSGAPLIWSFKKVHYQRKTSLIRTGWLGKNSSQKVTKNTIVDISSLDVFRTFIQIEKKWMNETKIKTNYWNQSTVTRDVRRFFFVPKSENFVSYSNFVARRNQNLQITF